MFTAAVIWLRSVPTVCFWLVFIGFGYKQILYEIILYECYGHGKKYAKIILTLSCQIVLLRKGERLL